MQPDDELCLCFHVTRRKLENYLRTHRLRRASQLSECFGAGTGCGWCRPFLHRLFERDLERRGEPLDSSLRYVTSRPSADLPATDQGPSIDAIDRDEYARRRAAHVRAGKGTPPPGAAPLPDDKAENVGDGSGE